LIDYKTMTSSKTLSKRAFFGEIIFAILLFANLWLWLVILSY